MFQVKWHHLGGHLGLMWRGWRWAGSEWWHFLAHTPQEHMALKEQSPWAVPTKPDNVTNLKTTVWCTSRGTGAGPKKGSTRELRASREATWRRVSPGVTNAPQDTLTQVLPSVVLFTENQGVALRLATIHACVMAKGTKLPAEESGTNVTRPCFQESVTLATQETRHPVGATFWHSGLRASGPFLAPAVLRQHAGGRSFLDY